MRKQARGVVRALDGRTDSAQPRPSRTQKHPNKEDDGEGRRRAVVSIGVFGAAVVRQDREQRRGRQEHSLSDATRDERAASCGADLPRRSPPSPAADPQLSCCAAVRLRAALGTEIAGRGSHARRVGTRKAPTPDPRARPVASMWRAAARCVGGRVSSPSRFVLHTVGKSLR